MNKPENWQMLCPVEQLSHAQCLEFEWQGEAGVNAAGSGCFVVNWHGEFYAYMNSCPHTRASMNWAPNQFFDLDNQLLHCGLHGALFEPATGLCIHGPCLGQSLTPVTLKVENGQIFAVKSL